MKNAVLLTIGLMTAVAAQAQMVIRLCYEDVTYFPWLIKDAHGLDQNLLEMTANRLGLKLDMQAMPWKRCLTEVGYGTLAAVSAASFNAERASFAAYPMADGKPDANRRMRYDSYTLYRLKGSQVTWDGKQFAKLDGPIGIQLGYSVGADLRKLGVEVDEAAVTPESQMRKVLAGRVRLVALLTSDGDQVLEKKEFSSRIERLSPPFLEKPYFLIFNKEYYERNRKMVDEFWGALALVRESAEFRAVRAARIKKGMPELPK